MPRKRRHFKRLLGNRRYRKLFVIATEGTKTEREYFAIFNDQTSVIQVRCLKSRQGKSPPQVLKQMKTHLKRENLRLSDEAWLVVDKDVWTDEQLSELHAWALTGSNFGFALSNPKFEYWLLLHFEEGAAIASPQECTTRLKRHLPGYDKGIDARKITHDHIAAAIHRAKRRDTPPCTDWPRALGGSTVYKLVENILRG